MRYLTLILAALLALPAQAREQADSFMGYRQLALPSRLAWPDAVKPGQVKDWIVLLHGSGPQNMDEDLAAATADRQANPFFKFLSDALVMRGFGVLRYDKRSYLVHRQAAGHPEIVQTEAIKAFANQPLTYLIEDGKAAVGWLHQQYPQARIHLVGHSEGTYIALQIARQLPQQIAGIGLIGFYDTSFDTTVFEQTVYRPLGWFNGLDVNHDQFLGGDELAGSSDVALQLRAQLSFLDRDRDGRISRAEFQAAGLTNLMVKDLGYQAYREDEAHYPRPHEILPQLDQPVAFFVGDRDNQTPLYQTLAVEMANQAVWHKSRFFFDYFKGLGHGLDPRSQYEDLLFQRADAAALARVSERLAQVLPR